MALGNRPRTWSITALNGSAKCWWISATWASTTPVQRIGEQVIAQPGYVWFRFWLLETELMVEKYFDPNGQVVGFYAPISLPFQRRTDTLRLITLVLAIWLRPNDRVHRVPRS